MMYALESIHSSDVKLPVSEQYLNSSHKLLSALSSSWTKRCQVRGSDALSHLNFEQERDDFLVELLPFSKDPQFDTEPKEVISKLLSIGWLIYNEKTIQIETEIVTPLCLLILRNCFSGVDDSVIKTTVSQAMVDEAYHVKLSGIVHEITLTFHLKAPNVCF